MGDGFAHHFGRHELRELVAERGAHVHIYGKSEARPGRKMGHLTALGETREAAVRDVLAARDALRQTATSASAVPR